MSLQHKRTKQTKDLIFRETVRCLDQFGYAETTFAKVQEAAGVSRGAITHHFPNRHALVAETALNMLGNIIDAIRRRGSGAPRPVREQVLSGWTAMVTTAEGRAFVEILVACRTDAQLRALLDDKLAEWDQEVNAWITRDYVGSDPAADDAEILWAIARSFFRGLIIHQQFVPSEDHIRRMIERFADIMESQMTVRSAARVG